MDMVSSEKVEELNESINNWYKKVDKKANGDFDSLRSVLGLKISKMFCDELKKSDIRKYDESAINDLISNPLRMMKHIISSRKIQPLLEEGVDSLKDIIKNYCLLDENVDKDELHYTKRGSERRADDHKTDADKAFNFERQYFDCIEEIIADVKGYILRQNYEDKNIYEKFDDVARSIKRELIGKLYSNLQGVIDDYTKKMYLDTYAQISERIVDELDKEVAEKIDKRDNVENNNNGTGNRQPQNPNNSGFDEY